MGIKTNLKASSPTIYIQSIWMSTFNVTSKVRAINVEIYTSIRIINLLSRRSSRPGLFVRIRSPYEMCDILLPVSRCISKALLSTKLALELIYLEENADGCHFYYQ
eukprot:UN21386